MIGAAAFHYDLLADMARELSIRSFFEVGVSGGGSFLATVKGGLATLRKVVACDTWGPHHGGKNLGSHAHIDRGLDALGYSGERVYLDGPSESLIPAYVKANPDRMDLVSVDADHSEAGEYGDLRNTWPLVGRAVVVHDIFMPTVWAAVSRFAKERVRELSRFDVSADGFGTAVLWRTG